MIHLKRLMWCPKHAVRRNTLGKHARVTGTQLVCDPLCWCEWSQVYITGCWSWCHIITKAGQFCLLNSSRNLLKCFSKAHVWQELSFSWCPFMLSALLVDKVYCPKCDSRPMSGLSLNSLSSALLVPSPSLSFTRNALARRDFFPFCRHAKFSVTCQMLHLTFVPSLWIPQSFSYSSIFILT